jgi:hypothetical protein
MTTETGNRSADSIPRRNSTECKALLDAATRELFENNVFRITGLAVDATSREIAKHAHKVTVMHGLGIANASAFPLKVPPTLDEIREAFEKLNKFPERRMVDEFFWFWPAVFGQASLDPAIQALAAGKSETAAQIWASAENDPTMGIVAKHNLAVLSHLRALELENDGMVGEIDAKSRGEIWKNSYKRWEGLIPDDAFWDKVSDRIRQIDDPGLTTGFARRMRGTLPIALIKVNAELALAWAKAGRSDLAKVHAEVMQEGNQGLDAVTKAGELVLAPTIARVREHIKRANQHTESDPGTADQVARDLISEALSLVEIFEWFFGEAEHPTKDLLEEVAITSINTLVGFQKKTWDDRTFIELLERTLPLTKTDHRRALILYNIGVGKKNLLHALFKAMRASTATPPERLQQFQREAIQPLQIAAASLDSNPEFRNSLLNDATDLLCDIGVEAWNKADKLTAMTANDLAIQFVCDPERRKILESNREIYSRVPVQPPAPPPLPPPVPPPAPPRVPPPPPPRLPKSPKRFNVAFLLAFLLLMFFIISSCQPRRESSMNRSYRPAAPWEEEIRVRGRDRVRGRFQSERSIVDCRERMSRLVDATAMTVENPHAELWGVLDLSPIKPSGTTAVTIYQMPSIAGGADPTSKENYSAPNPC